MTVAMEEGVQAYARSVRLASPRGFCAGVERAIAIVERALARFGPPVYVRHEVVHNRHVVERLRCAGAIFVDNLAEVPDAAPLVFSAHGVPLAVRTAAQARSGALFDATCPLVTKVHNEVARMHALGKRIVMIGHRGHPEVEGTMGQLPEGSMYLVEKPEDISKIDVVSDENLAFVTQTTLSVDDAADIVRALQQRFPRISGPRRDDICYATQNRQDAVKTLARAVDVVLVVGSPNSSNSNRLREVAEKAGATAYLVESAEAIKSAWLDKARTIGVTAGASAPEDLVQGVLTWLAEHAAGVLVKEEDRSEQVVFALPKDLAG